MPLIEFQCGMIMKRVTNELYTCQFTTNIPPELSFSSSRSLLIFYSLLLLQKPLKLLKSRPLECQCQDQYIYKSQSYRFMIATCRFPSLFSFHFFNFNGKIFFFRVKRMPFENAWNAPHTVNVCFCLFLILVC